MSKEAGNEFSPIDANSCEFVLIRCHFQRKFIMRRKILWITGLILLVVVLAGGAYTAVQLLSAQNSPADAPAGAMVFEDVMDDGSGSPVTVRTVVLPAAELPQRPPEASGILVRQEDNSYFVGTGNVSVSVNEIDGEMVTAVDHSGPEIEVVAGRDTQFYRDVTDVEIAFTESKEQTFQQELAAVEPPETMPDGSEFQVWGRQSGDRVIADVIVYSEPH